MLKVENLSLVFSKPGRDRPILKNLNFIAQPARVTALIGRSGAGKTSLLRCLAGLEKNYTGSILCSEVTADDQAPQIAYVSQSYSLFPHLTVFENCMLALRCVLKMPAPEATEVVQRRLGEVGMQDYQARLPRELSGGQQQRVAIARSLCVDAKVLILDEPTSALDPLNVDAMAELIRNIAKNGPAVVLSSQDMRFIDLVYDRIYVLDEGEIVESIEARTKPSCARELLEK